MVTRFRNGLAVLMAVFVFVMVTHTVACEVACASPALRVCCKAAVASMDMPSGHCHEAKTAALVTHHAQSASVCEHSVDLAVEKTAAVGDGIAAVRWVVVAVLRVQVAVPGGVWSAGQGPPLRVAWIDPLVVRLRV